VRHPCLRRDAPTFGVFAPTATPSPVVQRLADEIARLLAQPELRQKLVEVDTVPAPLGPLESSALVRREHDANARIVRAANLRAE
jgi:tripartite-type tricarboxylate transporter receptor subunit TctC